MELNQVKKVAAKVMKIGVTRVKIVDEEKVQQAMTKDDIRGLIKQGAIVQKRKVGVSRVRAKMIAAQKKKGRRKGQGKRKGASKARSGRKKKVWMKSVRSQRKTLRETKAKLGERHYRKLYKMISRGYFTSKAHLRKYIAEKKMLKDK